MPDKAFEYAQHYNEMVTEKNRDEELPRETFVVGDTSEETYERPRDGF